MDARQTTSAYVLNLLGCGRTVAMESRPRCNHPDAAAQRGSAFARAVGRWKPIARADPPPEIGRREPFPDSPRELVETDPGQPLRRHPPGRFRTDRPGRRSLGGRSAWTSSWPPGIGDRRGRHSALSFVQSRRARANEVLACQNNLRNLHEGLSAYAGPTAADSRRSARNRIRRPAPSSRHCTDAGQCPPGFHAICPAAAILRRSAEPVSVHLCTRSSRPRHRSLGQGGPAIRRRKTT